MVAICPVYAPKHLELVPSTVFFETAQHMRVMQNMLLDVVAKQHLLLMGNQGIQVLLLFVVVEVMVYSIELFLTRCWKE